MWHKLYLPSSESHTSTRVSPHCRLSARRELTINQLLFHSNRHSLRSSSLAAIFSTLPLGWAYIQRKHLLWRDIWKHEVETSVERLVKTSHNSRSRERLSLRRWQVDFFFVCVSEHLFFTFGPIRSSQQSFKICKNDCMGKTMKNADEKHEVCAPCKCKTYACDAWIS